MSIWIPQLQVVVDDSATDRTQQLCQEYWTLREKPIRGRILFRLTVAELADLFGLTAPCVSRIAEAYSYVYDHRYTCAKCDRPIRLRQRCELHVIGVQMHQEKFCLRCIREVGYGRLLT
jgi:hypothetical protein